LKLESDELLSIFAFKFNLRRYTTVDEILSSKGVKPSLSPNLKVLAEVEARGRGLHSFTVQLNLSRV
jgi:coenzyme F420-reducing hydrogenase beta subunit